MLLFGSSLENLPVMSLQTGTAVGEVASVIIDPHHLLIRAYQLSGTNLDYPDDSYLMINDIREFSNAGFIIDDSDELVQKDDIIQLKKLLQLDFKLAGLKAISQSGQKLGTVIDFTFETDTFLVVDLVIKRPFFKSIKDTELLVNRAKIVEIDNKQVVFEDETESLSAEAKQEVNQIGSFINPFRKNPEEVPNTPSRLN